MTQPTLLDTWPPTVCVDPEFGFQPSGVAGRRIRNGIDWASAASATDTSNAGTHVAGTGL